MLMTASLAYVYVILCFVCVCVCVCVCVRGVDITLMCVHARVSHSTDAREACQSVFTCSARHMVGPSLPSQREGTELPKTESLSNKRVRFFY